MSIILNARIVTLTHHYHYYCISRFPSRCGGKGGLWAVAVYCNGAIEQCGSGSNDVVGCCNITVGVERGIERGEDGSGYYLGV